jgi:hypothetical protein
MYTIPVFHQPHCIGAEAGRLTAPELAADPNLLPLRDKAGRPKKEDNDRPSIISRGATTDRLVARLKRDYPEIAVWRERYNYATFEEYCKERWEYVKQRVYQLIGAAEFAEKVHNCGLPLPSREAHIRPFCLAVAHLIALASENADFHCNVTISAYSMRSPTAVARGLRRPE